ncbi:MAG: hypothetical protein DCC55_07870 [Chloroflexi bacterium]|nr:MAG: hypothetical protein DCC55_07870 [Chloroflexota bacterium]
MEQVQPGIDNEKRPDNDNRKRRPVDQKQSTDQKPVKKESAGQRWRQARPTKTTVFWSALGAIVLTLILGFTWGGWVTGGTAQNMAAVSAQEALLTRLTPMCMALFNQDPERDEKLQALQATASYQRAAYVQAQGWATLPGEAQPDTKVAAECAKRLMLIDQ